MALQCGIIGITNVGKTTLFNLITKLISFDKGNIKIGGKNVTNWEDFKIAKKHISRTFQETRLFKNLSIKDHIEIALNKKDEKIIASIFHKKDETKKVKEALELVGLDKNMNTLASDLSYGQRKLLDLAIAIAKPHSVLMLDEPLFPYLFLK